MSQYFPFERVETMFCGLDLEPQPEPFLSCDSLAELDKVIKRVAPWFIKTDDFDRILREYVGYVQQLDPEKIAVVDSWRKAMLLRTKDPALQRIYAGFILESFLHKERKQLMEKGIQVKAGYESIYLSLWKSSHYVGVESIEGVLPEKDLEE